MNGTIFDEIKKKGDHKKKDKIKQVAAILSTNILVATLCLNLSDKQSLPASPSSKIKIEHSHYKTVIIPLSILVEQDVNQNETAVSILDKNKKVIIQKAYLHEEIKNPNKELGGLPYFKIEIPEEDILKISATGEDLMIAIPELKMATPLKKIQNRRESSYEINI